MQRTCYQSIAMAIDVRMRQERLREVKKKAMVRNHGSRTTHNTFGLFANVTRCL